MSVEWREMFAKYIRVVGENEGVHFLSSYQWDYEEWKEILALYDEQFQGWGAFSERERSHPGDTSPAHGGEPPSV